MYFCSLLLESLKMTLTHPLLYDGPLPETMNNPFDYMPHPVCEAAVRDILPRVQELMRNSPEGKMFGVLVVGKRVENKMDTNAYARRRPLYYLAAFSGQLDGRYQQPGFVPPVFDFLDPKGYFKRKETKITAINHEISRLQTDKDYLLSIRNLQRCIGDADHEIEKAKANMQEAKQRRDFVRAKGMISSEMEAAFVRESQFLKAELKRVKRSWAERLAEAQAAVDEYTIQLETLGNQRKMKSEALQQWLFGHFEMVNYRGEKRDLLQIFQDTVQQRPPAGTGDCCEPKLLQYAYTHGLEPVQMAMFWWGPSPDGEIRRHLHYYPACSGKCKPVLSYMLPPEVFAEFPGCAFSGQLEIVYEDADLWVVDKPSGMLSVPGKSPRESVISILKARCTDGDEPLVVHRLDMDTSGLLLVAKNKSAQRQLHKQFVNREIRKTYVAVLDGDPLSVGDEGRIELPLAPDLMHRPFQKVDKKQGRPSVTLYRVVGEHVVELYPLTGRTHQLRVHCAHADGLNRSIKGDNLYGRRADRLYLHASRIEFTHPGTGERMVFSR